MWKTSTEELNKIENFNLRTYLKAAVKLDCQYRILIEDRLAEIKHGNSTYQIFRAITPLNSFLPGYLSLLKHLTSDLLELKGLPCARYKLFHSLAGAVEYFESAPYRIVVKPADNSGGNGVTIRPKNREEFINAYQYANEYSDKVLVEEFIEGENYRVLVLDGEVLAVARRIPAFVVADGTSTIKELIDSENLRRKDTPLNEIKIDNEVTHFLESMEYNLASVLPAGSKIQCRGNSNLSTGGVSEDVTEKIHSDNRQIAVDAARAIGLRLAGIDIITQDISVSMIKSGGVINEVNRSPGLTMHYYPILGSKREVALDIVKAIIKTN